MPEIPYMWKIVTGKKRKLIGKALLCLSIKGDHAVFQLHIKKTNKLVELRLPFVLYTMRGFGPRVEVEYALDATKISAGHLKLFMKQFGSKK